MEVGLGGEVFREQKNKERRMLRMYKPAASFSRKARKHFFSTQGDYQDHCVPYILASLACNFLPQTNQFEISLDGFTAENKS